MGKKLGRVVEKLEPLSLHNQDIFFSSHSTMSVITCTAIEKCVPQLFGINETMCCKLFCVYGIDKKLW